MTATQEDPICHENPCKTGAVHKWQSRPACPKQVFTECASLPGGENYTDEATRRTSPGRAAVMPRIASGQMKSARTTTRQVSRNPPAGDRRQTHQQAYSSLQMNSAPQVLRSLPAQSRGTIG